MRLSKYFCCASSTYTVEEQAARSVAKSLNQLEKIANRDNNSGLREMVSVVRNNQAPFNARGIMDGMMRIHKFYDWAESGPAEERSSRLAAVQIIGNTQAEKRGPTSRRVNLSGMGLTSLPERMAMFSDITELDISENRLTALSNFPPALLVLHLNNNCLEHLPPLPLTLQYLNVKNNRLTDLPIAMGMMHYPNPRRNTGSPFPEVTPSTLEVDVTNNHLTTFPDLFLQANPHGEFGENPWSPTALQSFSRLKNSTVVEHNKSNGGLSDITLHKFPLATDQNAMLNGYEGFYGGMTSEWSR